ncbi:unnamed protein product, partial [Closterium sp. NIES-54]
PQSCQSNPPPPPHLTAQTSSFSSQSLSLTLLLHPSLSHATLSPPLQQLLSKPRQQTFRNQACREQQQKRRKSFQCLSLMRRPFLLVWMKCVAVPVALVVTPVLRFGTSTFRHTLKRMRLAWTAFSG